MVQLRFMQGVSAYLFGAGVSLGAQAAVNITLQNRCVRPRRGQAQPRCAGELALGHTAREQFKANIRTKVERSSRFTKRLFVNAKVQHRRAVSSLKCNTRPGLHGQWIVA